MRSTALTRFTGALNCLNALRDVIQQMPGRSVLDFVVPTSELLDDCSAMGQKFCLIHTSFDPLPVAGSLGFCLPESCTNVELTDILSTMCSLPSCSLLEPLEVFSSYLPSGSFDQGNSIVSSCGFGQRLLCGPDDRTIMQHDIKFTCIPTSDGRRKLLEADDEMAENWLTDLEQKVNEFLKNSLDNSHLQEMLTQLERMVADLVGYMESELEKAFQNFKKDAIEELADVKDMFRAVINGTRVGDKIEGAIDRLNARVQKRVEEIRSVLQRIKSKITSDSDLHDAIQKTDAAIKGLADKGIEQVIHAMHDIHDTLHKWIEDHKARDSSDSAKEWLTNEVNSIDKSLNSLSQQDVNGLIKDQIAKLQELISAIRSLIDENVIQIEKDVTDLMDQVKMIIDKLRRAYIPSTSTTTSLPHSAEAASTFPSETTDHELRILKFNDTQLTVTTKDLVYSLNRLLGDFTRVTAKGLFDLSSEESLRRDIHKVDKLCSRLSSQLTEKSLGDWNDIREKIEAALDQITETITELRKKVTNDMSKRIKEDKSFVSQIIGNFTTNSYEFLQKHWIEIVNNTRAATGKLEFDIDEIRNRISEIVNTEVESILNNSDHLYEEFVDKITKLLSKLKTDLAEMIDQLENEIFSTSTSTTVPPTTFSSASGFSAMERQLNDEHLGGLEDLISDLSIRNLIIPLLKSMNAADSRVQSILSNATFVSEIMSHFKPNFKLADIPRNEPLWISKDMMTNVLECGADSIRNTEQVLYSGHLPQSVGDYYGCVGDEKQNSSNHYCLVKSAGVIAQGRCVSTKCDTHALEDLTRFLCNWRRNDRSCFELVNIVPLDYCLYASTVGCGILDKIPEITDPKSILNLPEWFARPSGNLNHSWWTYIRTTNGLQIDPSVRTHLLNLGFLSRDYNITDVADHLGYPQFNIVCTEPGTSYWNIRSITGWTIVSIVLIAAPISGSYIKEFSVFSVRRSFAQYKAGINKNSGLATSSLNGMRVISMLWIICGHTLASVLLSNLIENYEDTVDLMHSFTMQGIIGGVFAVDSFFAFSGFLLGYKASSMLPSTRPQDWLCYLKSVVLGVCRRWSRLSPCYYLLFAVFVLILPNLISAPLYGSYSHFILNGQGGRGGCRNTWYWHLVYLDNLFPSDSMDNCMGWSWYLANELQLTILGLALAALFYCSRSAYKHMWVSIIILCAVTTSVQEIQKRYSIGYLSLSMTDGTPTIMEDINNAIDRQILYIRPWPRAMGYLIALTAGLYLSEADKKIDNSLKSQPLLEQTTPMMLKNEERFNRQEFTLQTELTPMPPTQDKLPSLLKFVANHLWRGHLVCLTLMMLIMWLPWFKVNYVDYRVWPYAITLFYNVFSRSVWTVCVLWFVFVFYLCKRGYVTDLFSTKTDELLSSRFFGALAPLVYCSYLLHMIIQEVYYAAIPSSAYVSIWEGFHEWLGWVPLTFACAFVLYIVVELPLSSLLF